MGKGPEMAARQVERREGGGQIPKNGGYSSRRQTIQCQSYRKPDKNLEHCEQNFENFGGLGR